MRDLNEQLRTTHSWLGFALATALSAVGAGCSGVGTESGAGGAAGAGEVSGGSSGGSGASGVGGNSFAGSTAPSDPAGAAGTANTAGGPSANTAGGPGANTAGAGGNAAGGSSGNTAGAAGNAAGGSSGGRGGSSGSSGSSGAAGAATLPDVSVYLAGDSTVSEYTLDPANPKSWAGWGQMLGPHYAKHVTVVDAAVGGRTARRFIQEGSLDAILKKLRAGDYLLVQFGTNDSNPTATYSFMGTTYPYFADADTDFKTYLRQYIDGAKAKQAIAVLVTPPPRNSAYCNGGRSLANYGQAMIELAQASQIAVVDLGLKAHAYLSAICPKPSTGAQETFFKVNADGSIDGTHFQENGARLLAGFVADGIDEAKLGLAAYRSN